MDSRPCSGTRGAVSIVTIRTHGRAYVADMRVRDAMTTESWEALRDEELALLDLAEPDEIVLDSEWHELTCERDPHRWELDPASAEDWLERHRSAAF